MTRGVRNNNPGNLRHGSHWEGLAPAQNDPDFCVFVAPEYGIRALVKLLLVYTRIAKPGTRNGYGLKTVREIIHRWAPPTENDTGAYVGAVAKHVGVSRDQVIVPLTYDRLKLLVESIIAHENAGYQYPDSVVEQGLVLAGVIRPQGEGG